MAALSRAAIPPRLLARPRLLRRLMGPWKVAVLSAPAGYGKTTLAAQLAARRRSCWLRAAPEMADPARLLGAILEAAARSEAPAGRRTAELFASRRDLERDGGLLSASLTDELSETPRLVVMDDLHAIAGAAGALAWLRRLVEDSGPRVRFLFTCRGECPLPLARLEAAGGVVTLGARELAFTPDEQSRLFSRVFRHRLAPGENAALHAQVGGWPAGLALAARRGAGVPVDATFAAGGPAGRAERLERFLEEEVLAPLAPSFRARLEKLALADALDADSARLALGIDPRATLAEIRRRDLFVQPGVGSTPDRFHPLMRAALLSGFRRRLSERRRAVSVRPLAARWRREGDSPRAIRLLLEAGLPATARALFERAAAGRAAGGEDAALGALAEPLALAAGGAGRLPLSPWIRLHRAHHATLEGRGGAAMGDTRAAREAFAARAEWGAAARAFRLEALIAMREGRARAAQAAGTRLLARVPVRQRRARAEIARTLSEAAQRSGDPRASARWLDAAERALGRAATPLERADFVVRRATAIYTEGRWEEYAEAIRGVLPRFRRAGYWRRVQGLLFNLAEASIYMGDEPGALGHLDDAASIGRRAAMAGAPLIEAELRARAHSERGEWGPAARGFAAARALPGAAAGTFVSLRLDVWEGILLRRRGRLGAARRRLDRAIAGFSRLESPSWLGVARMERALVRGLQGETAEALAELAAAARVSRRHRDARELARNALFEAAVRDAGGGDGSRALRRAIAALEQLDYLVLLRKEADVARPLLERRRPRPKAPPPAAPRRARVAIELLGGFRIRAAGREVPLPRAASRALIARLALARDHALRREALAEWLWPGAPAAGSRNRLDVALHAARRALEPAAGRRGPFAVLIADQGWCRLAPERVAVDAHEFERRARDCEPLLQKLDADPWRPAAGLAPPQRRPALARIERALASCRGPLFPEHPGAEIAEARARLEDRERRLRLAAGLLRHALGDHAGAIECATRVLDDDPLSESACRLEALARLALGDRATARRRVRAFVRRASRALGAPPGPELMALAARLEGGEPLP